MAWNEGVGEDECRGCESLGSRREFLREAAALAAAALAALGVTSRVAVAMPVGAVTGRRLRRANWVSYPIPATDGVEIDKEHQVILVRHAGVVYAFALSCPHQNTALRWNERESRFQCPKHKSKYRPDGEFISGRATRNMDRLPIKREGASVAVDVDLAFESDKDKAGWSAAAVNV